MTMAFEHKASVAKARFYLLEGPRLHLVPTSILGHPWRSEWTLSIEFNGRRTVSVMIE